MTKQLPKYADCENSLFISYANSDNEGNGWVKYLSDAIETKLTAKLKSASIKTKKIVFHGSAQLAAGSLPLELRKEINESFAMMLVVGEHYAQSDTCKNELDYFIKFWGRDGLTSRFFIVAMTEAAVKEARNNKGWEKLNNIQSNWFLSFLKSWLGKFGRIFHALY